MIKKIKFQHAMITPTVIILACLTIFPLAYTIYYSFTDYYYLALSPKKFIGIENYINILKNNLFIRSLFNTIKFMLLAVIIEILLGLALAVFVESFNKKAKILRIVLLLPSLLPPVTVALIWQMMFSNNNGIINQLLGYIGIGPVNWLMDVRTAFYAILAIDVWQWTPFAFLLIYANLLTVPKDQYEAAEIDGASSWNKFWYITLPNIMPGIMLVVLLRTIDTFRLFDKVNILTKGGPANSTTTITQFIYINGIFNLKIGYSSAASLIMAFIVLIISMLYVKKAFETNKN